MIAGLLGVLSAESSSAAPGMEVHAALACPAQSEAHRPLLVKADDYVEAGEDEQAARSFVSAYDAMDLGNQVGGSGKFAADRAVTSYLKAWRIDREVEILEEAERYLLRYIERLDDGISQGCSTVDRKWADEKLAEVRAEMPKGPAPEDPPVEPGKPKQKDCPQQAAIFGVDRVGVALVTVGASLFVAGAGLLIPGAALPNLNGRNAFMISGAVTMGVGTAFIIPGAVRLASWRRKKSRARLGVMPWTGRGLAGVSVSGRFGAMR